MDYIARIHSDFPTKFGIPRQSGLTGDLISKIVFEPAYRNPDFLRGIDSWSHLWLIWRFDRIEDGKFSPTVAPPKLGGKTRVGVFATRSPFRPNPIGLSCVKLVEVNLHTKDGPVLYVAGADLADQTPIYDIKPYLPYADCHPDATDAFEESRSAKPLEVVFPDVLLQKIPTDKRAGLIQALSQNPRPGYQHDPNRRYGFKLAGFDVRFQIDGDIKTSSSVFRLDPNGNLEQKAPEEIKTTGTVGGFLYTIIAAALFGSGDTARNMKTAAGLPAAVFYAHLI